MRIPAIAIAFLLTVGEGSGRLPQAHLQSVIEQLTEDSAPDAWESLSRAAAEEGPDAFTRLTRFLSSKKRLQQDAAAHALAFTGHSDAPKTLLDYYRQNPQSGNKAAVCFVLPQRGLPSDVRFLTQALKGEHYGSSWQPIEVAALALGIIREASAVPALEATARKDQGSIAAGAARQALDWIREGSFEVPPSDQSPSIEPILAVMAHGVPRVGESQDFVEHKARRVWTRRTRKWTLRPLEESGLRVSDAPSISFETFVSSDGSRSIVSVGLVFGRLNGVGYDYLLFRKGTTWRVVGIQPTWIS